jgi:hypothetical protein
MRTYLCGKLDIVKCELLTITNPFVKYRSHIMKCKFYGNSFYRGFCVYRLYDLTDFIFECRSEILSKKKSKSLILLRHAESRITGEKKDSFVKSVASEIGSY